LGKNGYGHWENLSGTSSTLSAWPQTHLLLKDTEFLPPWAVSFCVLDNASATQQTYDSTNPTILNENFFLVG
jgi:hypothetical protein